MILAESLVVDMILWEYGYIQGCAFGLIIVQILSVQFEVYEDCPSATDKMSRSYKDTKRIFPVNCNTYLDTYDTSKNIERNLYSTDRIIIVHEPIESFLRKFLILHII